MLSFLRIRPVTFQARWGQRKVVHLRGITLDRKPTSQTEEVGREFMLLESSRALELWPLFSAG